MTIGHLELYKYRECPQIVKTMEDTPFDKNVSFFVSDWKLGRGLHTRDLIHLIVTGDIRFCAAMDIILGVDTDYLHIMTTIFVLVSDVFGAKNYLGDFPLHENLSVNGNVLISV